MPRLTKVIMPGNPHHIVQRGHNLKVVFIQPKDYQGRPENQAERKVELGLKVLCYFLMSAHVHMVVEIDGAKPDQGRRCRQPGGL